jgi:hypothetical protein
VQNNAESFDSDEDWAVDIFDVQSPFVDFTG